MGKRIRKIFKQKGIQMNPEPEYWDDIPQFDEGNLE